MEDILQRNDTLQDIFDEVRKKGGKIKKSNIFLGQKKIFDSKLYVLAIVYRLKNAKSNEYQSNIEAIRNNGTMREDILKKMLSDSTIPQIVQDIKKKKDLIKYLVYEKKLMDQLCLNEKCRYPVKEALWYKFKQNVKDYFGNFFPIKKKQRLKF